MLCVNIDRTEQLKPLVIGKFQQNTRCFKNVRSLPVTYCATVCNWKAWMVSYLFVSWVRRLDRKFTHQRQKVLLFIDYCAAATELESIMLLFLPPNTTSHLQPMDQGVIMNLKVHYRQNLLQCLLAAYDVAGTPSPINVKQAIHMVFEAWKLVKLVKLVKAESICSLPLCL